ncbi:sensor histidine kinase [Tenacibaculum piscium]|uniref:histidine kinase n=1 Tax=Tenacibaculum piscium TaxID=1458515 RepID=A0A2H1YER0_9FLAO|nr:HAMP domain-containing sensor histidine kinase [Tenacibaculum piscium]MBE7628835.1 sensor histidine kinase [Tenacibaculum piscium]MBE7671138.1 sensor histidine kinase [Tenacibaculum piscium]MBE7685143.1 sensor histidine kinase [Tenacibaculum piscium]MBE7689846.1 sensor histidine kinase [Tenacibaculum piscium]SOS73994.1 Histidine kinase [Tenacibaculum piscium]
MEFISTEEKLKERIKELTCLYNVSSLVRNTDFSNIEILLKGIASNVVASIRYPVSAFVAIETQKYHVVAGKEDLDAIFILDAIKVFGDIIGTIKVGYARAKFSENAFLEEEKLLLNKVASEIGDFFERKQLKEREILSKRQMERVDRLAILGEITAGIAHELNTPLANILGFTELLQERFKEDKIGAKDLKKVINSAIYSREVVKKLMFFSCEMPQQMEVINCVPIIKQAISLLRPNFRKKNITAQLHFNKKNIPLKVDKIQLTQVIFNLVINAIYFSPIDGEIEIEIEQTKSTVKLKISDKGTGISATVKENIFNPFFTTKPTGEGSGLGLSVVHGIVKSHGGTIKYKSNKPTGAIFILRFPRQKI